MARCPFALDAPVGYNPGTYVGGPWRVVWHKTQGATFSGALAAYRAGQVAPHFTVDEAGQVRQHFDTDGSAYAVVHNGQPDTNRLHAIQIEVVGFCGQTMNPAQLQACLALAAWIDRVHGVPPVWPLGRPTGARDPRTVAVWTGQAGHYGHSHVPQNDHTDPAWTDAEWQALAFATAPVPLPAPPAPAPPMEASGMNLVTEYHPCNLPLDANGHGWIDVAHDFSTVASLIVQGSSPPDDGYWAPVTVEAQPRAGVTRVDFYGAPGQLAGVFVKVLTP